MPGGSPPPVPGARRSVHCRSRRRRRVASWYTPRCIPPSLAPSLFMDVDGSYRGPDHQIHHADGFTFRSTFSLWDTYRALHPLLTLLRPRSDNLDFVRSLLASWQDSPDGLLPVWQFHGQETWTM